jgi:hypothetical protein
MFFLKLNPKPTLLNIKPLELAEQTESLRKQIFRMLVVYTKYEIFPLSMNTDVVQNCDSVIGM